MSVVSYASFVRSINELQQWIDFYKYNNMIQGEQAEKIQEEIIRKKTSLKKKQFFDHSQNITKYSSSYNIKQLLNKAKQIVKFSEQTSQNKDNIQKLKKKQLTKIPKSNTFVTGINIYEEQMTKKIDPHPQQFLYQQQPDLNQMLKKISNFDQDLQLEKLIKRIQKTTKLVNNCGKKLKKTKESVCKLASFDFNNDDILIRNNLYDPMDIQLYKKPVYMSCKRLPK